MSVKNVSDISREQVNAGTSTFRQILIPPEEGANFAMRRFVIEPGGSMPNHTNTVEHEQYVLGGKAEVGIGEQVFEVKQNDVVYIPANMPHWYKTIGDRPFEFLCMVPNKPDKIELV